MKRILVALALAVVGTAYAADGVISPAVAHGGSGGSGC